MSMPGQSHPEPPIEYRDRQGRVWHASEVAQIRVVAPAIDGPNVCLVIRFEREGEERFAHWMGGEEWRLLQSLHRLFAESEGEGDAEGGTAASIRDEAVPTADDDAGAAEMAVPTPETVALWVKLVASMGPDRLAQLEERTFRAQDPASLGDLRRAIARR